jgi:acyl carrier protein
MIPRLSIRATLGLLSLIVFLVGCGSNSGVPETSVANMQDLVSQILKKEPAQIDVTKSLYALGANEADIANIVMAIEGTFQVELPSSEIGQTLGDIGNSMTVQKLADVASKQPRTKKSD